MAQVIKRTGVNPWGQAFGVIGQGLSGFTNGMMAKKMMDMWGKNGEMIKPPVAGAAAQPVAAGGVQQPTTAAQPAQNQPTAQGGAAGGADLSSPISFDDLMAMIYKQPNTYGA